MSDPTRSWEGRCFEEFKVGDVYRHAHGRTITEADNTWFTLLTNNSNPIFIFLLKNMTKPRPYFQKQTVFGKEL